MIELKKGQRYIMKDKVTMRRLGRQSELYPYGEVEALVVEISPSGKRAKIRINDNFYNSSWIDLGGVKIIEALPTRKPEKE